MSKTDSVSSSLQLPAKLCRAGVKLEKTLLLDAYLCLGVHLLPVPKGTDYGKSYISLPKALCITF